MEKLRTPLISALLTAILAGVVFFLLQHNTQSYPIEIKLPPPSQEIKVYVGGQVQNLGYIA